MLKILISFYLLGCFGSGIAFARPVLKNLPSKQKLEELYYKHFKKFNKQLCSHGEDQKFEKLYQAYKGRGDYVPTLANGRIDRVAIRKNIPFLKEKLEWIKELLSKVKKEKDFSLQLANVKKIRHRVHELLEFKKNYYFTKDVKKRNSIKQQSRETIRLFKEEYKQFLESIYFLKTFHFPVDFYALRNMYDKSKEGKKFTRNQLYLFRRIVEDGAQNAEHKKSDRFLRTALSSVYLTLMSHHTIISEDLRYDLTTTLERIEKILKGGVSLQIERLSEWKERVKDELQFYRKVVHFSRKQEKSFLARKHTGQERLKHFVKRKQEAVYNFWSRRPEYLRAIFALETILMNEVGDVDPEGLERRDVAQVVVNRWHKHWYGYLGKKDFLFDVETNPKTRKRLAKFRWLNVLFKKGEFSFTYYFIHSNYHIFCPDLSRRGEKLRKENVKIAIDSLKYDRSSFKAERYFSRASMIGRVDMTKIWKKFVAYPERAGRRIVDDKRLQDLYQQGKFEFYYFFKDPWGRFFRVLNIAGNTYSVSFNGKEFYTYRNRHYFKYFVPLN